MLTLHDISGNHQRLDGGAMFGNAPRALWSRLSPPDELGRIGLACRCFLVDTGDRLVLLEAGIGVFFEPALRERYGVVESEHVLLESLKAAGTSHEKIDAVVLSHLHFDHAGGLLDAWAEGRDMRLLFPNARFVVGEAALQRARSPHVRDRASFIAELPALLEATGRLEVVPTGAQHTDTLGPRFELFETNGHTPGMLHTVVKGKARSAVYCADFIPGTAWVHAPITMGYDRWPEQLINEKLERYPAWERDGTWLLFTHDEQVVASKIKRDERGRYAPTAQKTTLGAGWDLDGE